MWVASDVCVWWHVPRGLLLYSLERNGIYAMGASALSAALVHVPQLQSLQYVALQW